MFNQTSSVCLTPLWPVCRHECSVDLPQGLWFESLLLFRALQVHQPQKQVQKYTLWIKLTPHACHSHSSLFTIYNRRNPPTRCGLQQEVIWRDTYWGCSSRDCFKIGFARDCLLISFDFPWMVLHYTASRRLGDFIYLYSLVMLN